LKNWFEVDRKGLKALQLGKPKYYAVRELLQNAWDEHITKCTLTMKQDRGMATIIVEDNSPIGFRDLKDAYTLFKDCYKRKDPKKRGRFNVGEKQAFSICKKVIITTTKGTIVFDDSGRHNKRSKTEQGTIVQIELRMNKKEFAEMEEFVKLCIPPMGIKFFVNGEIMEPQVMKHDTIAKLPTEFQKDGVMRKTRRSISVRMHEPIDGKSYLYEIGIPVCPINCKYSIDVMQRIPMGLDRDTVSETYLKDLYAIILNETYKELETEESSEAWVRTAMSDKHVSKQAVSDVITKRFGDKVCIATPNDRNSVDDAVSKGFNVIYGSELSKDEWENVRKAQAVQSSHDLFGRGSAPATSVTPDENMEKIADFCKQVAFIVFNKKIQVRFAKWDSTLRAEYGDDVLTFNVEACGPRLFDTLSVNLLKLIIHEIGHEYGNHTEHSYHEALCTLGAKLVRVALDNPEFFQ